MRKLWAKKHATKLHLHHITYKNLFNEKPEDLILLCAVCHMKEHGLIKVKLFIKKPKKKKRNKKQNRLFKEKIDRIERDYKKGKYSYNGYILAKISAYNN